MSQRSQWRPGWFLGVWMLLAPVAPAHEVFSDCSECPRMVVIAGGSFTMGSPRQLTDSPRRRFEGPIENVQVASFAIGETEVTRGQYAAFVKATKRTKDGGCFTFGFSSFTDDSVDDPHASWRNPGFAQSDAHPVVCVSWDDANAYAAWLSRKTGQSYRLPSEAEWEYAARAGTTATFFWGEEEERSCTYANGGDSTLMRALPVFEEVIAAALRDGDSTARLVKCSDGNAFTSAVRGYRPNAFGLYDMIGNAWEPVADCRSQSLPASAVAHVEPPCEQRRVRGGSWDDYPEELRSARRSAVRADKRRNDGGFRLARTLSAAEVERAGR